MSEKDKNKVQATESSTENENTVNSADNTPSIPPKAEEVGGPKGLEPTRYGDWEKGGRCIDF
jgi:hypothetical protein